MNARFGAKSPNLMLANITTYGISYKTQKTSLKLVFEITFALCSKFAKTLQFRRAHAGDRLPSGLGRSAILQTLGFLFC